MTFNSSQQERLLTALERIADALEAQTKPPRFVHYGGKTFDRGTPADTDPNSTKGPYR